MYQEEMFAINLSKIYNNIAAFMYQEKLKAKQFRYFCKLLYAITHDNISEIRQACEASHYRALFGDRFNSSYKEVLILDDSGASLYTIVIKFVVNNSI
jgi:hypothetical protein